MSAARNAGNQARRTQPGDALLLQGACRQRIDGLGRQANDPALGQARYGPVDHVAGIVAMEQVDPLLKVAEVSAITTQNRGGVESASS